MKPRKRIIVEERKMRYITEYCIVGQVRGTWRWRDDRYFGSFRAAMGWIKSERSGN